jgi:hypothetical protein
MSMDRSIDTAARLPGVERIDLTIQALARTETVSDLAAGHGVSRKFLYRQARRARAALDEVFVSTPPGAEVLFERQSQTALRCNPALNHARPGHVSNAWYRDDQLHATQGCKVDSAGALS